MKRAYNLLIGEAHRRGNQDHPRLRLPLDEEMTMEVKGRDSVAGLHRKLLVENVARSRG